MRPRKPKWKVLKRFNAKVQAQAVWGGGGGGEGGAKEKSTKKGKHKKKNIKKTKYVF